MHVSRVGLKTRMESGKLRRVILLNFPISSFLFKRDHVSVIGGNLMLVTNGTGYGADLLYVMTVVHAK